MRHFRFPSALAVGATSLLMVGSALHAQTLGTGAFPDAASIEKELRRGASIKSDVQRLLGVPNGTGRAEMAPYAALRASPLGDGPREIWYYDDIEVTDMKSTPGVMTMKLRQQILLVFFKGETFDGYLWTTNAFLPTAE